MSEQGQGRHTGRKQGNLAAALGVSLSVSKGGAAASYPYWHIDLNAGCGWNHKAGCLGSPLVFVRQAGSQRHRRTFNALFCDRDGAAVAELSGRLDAELVPCGSQMRMLAGDSADALDQFTGWIASARENPRYTVGTCYSDPNGPKDVPYDRLRRFAAEFPAIDLILNLNVSTYMMMSRWPHDGRFSRYLMPADLLDTLSRQHWMVSNPPTGGGSSPGMRFVLAVGTNYPTGSRRYKDFYPLGSQIGQEIITQFKHVQDGQGLLFPDCQE